MVLAKACLF